MPLSAQRLAVLEHVRAQAPARIADTATALGLHPNTVREHLEALVGLGLLERHTGTSAGRGRPAALYRPSPADPAIPARDYAGLATALAGHLARTSDYPERDARAAGNEWGRELMEEALADAPASAQDPRRAVLHVLTRLGFAPDDDAPGGQAGIALRRCPLLEAARRYPTVVCQVHLGIIEGILERLGATVPPDLDLVPFAEPGACRLFLPNPVVRHGY